MEYYEARSLKEIRVMLKNNGYNSKSKIRDHLSFLENLAAKISQSIKDERELGEVAWTQQEDLKKVHDIFEELCGELNKIEVSKMDHLGRPKGLF
jgi:hypothetical protein